MNELKGLESRVKIQGEKMMMLRFADDIVILAESENELKIVFNAMNSLLETKFDF